MLLEQKRSLQVFITWVVFIQLYLIGEQGTLVDIDPKYLRNELELGQCKPSSELHFAPDPTEQERLFLCILMASMNTAIFFIGHLVLIKVVMRLDKVLY